MTDDDINVLFSVLRTVREKLWIDPEVVARVQSIVTYDEAWERESYVTLLISDVKAMLAALTALPQSS